MAHASMSAPDAPAARASTLGLLLRLRWTLMLRSYSRSRTNQIGLAITALVFGPISVGAATLTYLIGHDSANDTLLAGRAVLMVIYVLWIAAPLLGFPLNESYDPTRLFVFPVTLRTILAGGVLGSLFEPTTLLAVPVCFAVILLFCKSVFAALIAIVAVALFMLHTLAVAQFLLLSLVGLLRSRKFRDVTIVALPLIAFAAYAAEQVFARGAISDVFGLGARLGIWRFIAWLPPGWAISACVDAVSGEYAFALLFLAMLALAVLAPIPLAAAALDRLYNGERGVMPADSRPVARPAIPRNGALRDERIRSSRISRISGDIAALAWKEKLYLLREPQYKAMVASGLYFVVVIVAGFGFSLSQQARDADLLFRHPHESFQLASIRFFPTQALLVARALAIPSFLLLSSTQLIFNIFGGEGSAITVLLTFPTHRVHLIVAKNLAYAPVAVALGAVGAVASVLVLHVAQMIVLEIAWIVAAALVIVGVGNLVSVRFPMRLIVRGQRYKSGGSVTLGGAAGCAYAYLQSLCYLVAVALLVPAALAFLLPPLLGAPAFLWLSVPIGVAYAGIIYWSATVWAAALLVRREPDMIAVLAPDD